MNLIKGGDMNYHYKCKTCGNEFTLEQSIYDEPIQHCPVCMERAVYRVIQPVKGFGFRLGEGHG